MSQVDMMKLREELAARDIEWSGDWDNNGMTTSWESLDGQHFQCFQRGWNGNLAIIIRDVTPEQAIAATLGSEREKKLESLVRFMEPFFKSAVSHECGCPEGYFEPHGCDNGCMALKELDEHMAALGLLEVD